MPGSNRPPLRYDCAVTKYSLPSDGNAFKQGYRQKFEVIRNYLSKSQDFSCLLLITLFYHNTKYRKREPPVFWEPIHYKKAGRRILPAKACDSYSLGSVAEPSSEDDGSLDVPSELEGSEEDDDGSSLETGSSDDGSSLDGISDGIDDGTDELGIDATWLLFRSEELEFGWTPSQTAGRLLIS